MDERTACPDTSRCASNGLERPAVPAERDKDETELAGRRPAAGVPVHGLSFQDMDSHFSARIADAPIQTEPFPHCYIRDVFPPDFYQAILKALPADDCYANYPPPYEARLFFNLDPPTAGKLGRFWQEFEGWINSQPFLGRMADKFASFLPHTYCHRKALVDKSTVGDAVGIGCRTLVTRDYGDFALGPHSDSTNKFITAIFYLPKDERFSSFGTSIYRPKEAGFTDFSSRHYKHDQFDLIRTFPNLPNSLFLFVKTENSFHGVEPGDYPNDGRNLLMWIPQIGISSMNWSPLELPRSVLAD